MTLPSLLETSAAVFHFSKGGRYDSADLFLQSAQYQEALTSLKPGAYIYVVGTVSAELLLAYYAVWRFGHVLVPIDSKTALATQQSYLTTVPADGVIWADAGLVSSHISSLYRDIPVLHKQQGAVVPKCGAPLRPTSAENQPALVIFTSGSTGKPKGVLLSYGNLLAGAENIRNAMQINASDFALCLLPLNHINGIVTTLITPLVTSSKVCFYDDNFSVERVKAVIRQHLISWVSAVPFHYNQFVEQSLTTSDVNSVRFFRSASAPLLRHVIQQFEANTQRPLIETMGMSEASGQIFANPMPPAVRKPGKIGLPVGFEAAIRAENGEFLAAGQEGELVYRGAGLMQGYLIDGQCQPETDSWFRSGDLGFVDEDGYFEITGRAKDIFIFCGENVSLRSLELALAALPFVKDVAAKAARSASFGEVADIYLVLEGVALHDIKAVLLQALLNNAVGSISMLGYLYQMDVLPRSSAGKALKGFMSSDLALDKVECRPVFNNAATLVAAVLNTEPSDLGADAAMGNTTGWDSLAQTVISIELEQAIKRKLTPDEIMQATSISGVQRILQYDNEGAKPVAVAQDQQAISAYITALKQLGFAQHKVNYLILSMASVLKRGISHVPQLLTQLIDEAGPDAIICMNTFNWSFCRGSAYDSSTSACETGMINEIFRQMPNVHRSAHPIYSYAVHGLSAAEVQAFNGESSWGEASFLNYLCQQDDVNVICHGPALLKGNPAIHWVEQQHQVPYRYHKTFTGLARLSGEKRMTETKATMFVRKLGDDEFVNDWSTLITNLTSSQALRGQLSGDTFYAYSLKSLTTAADNILTLDKFGLAVKK
ncbi:AMP-binding protein [Rheinheimera maricola]|uniref:aminoglycoside N(3)-acetyltransferase n=1 Tax=Rheinheimera maricola TaxID=2793282 RepID=A0ABS7X668_9GAMM|nr:AMP-binding protein [Rheinheimera maricola]MBZ9610213.1 AMP-binding protein [Rheinheimera maricola]